MKFAIRDDDLNYFFTPSFIEHNIKDIWDICPISMSSIPFVKGDWTKNTQILEKLGSNNVTDDIVASILKDNAIYDIAENKELVSYIKEKIKENKIYLTIHAIHHRNEDDNLPSLNNNFSIGAEFYTNRDLTSKLRDAINHLENIFGQKIKIFTPPQNVYNEEGLSAIVKNGLDICGYLPFSKFKVRSSIRMMGFFNFIRVFYFKFMSRSQKKVPYYKYLKVNKIKIMDHKSLQPGTDIEKLYNDFDYIYKKNGNFVLSTHSYGFNHKMQGSDKTMGEVLKEFLFYVKKKNNVEFVTLDKIFGDK